MWILLIICLYLFLPPVSKIFRENKSESYDGKGAGNATAERYREDDERAQGRAEAEAESLE